MMRFIFDPTPPLWVANTEKQWQIETNLGTDAELTAVRTYALAFAMEIVNLNALQNIFLTNKRNGDVIAMATDKSYGALADLKKFTNLCYYNRVGVGAGEGWISYGNYYDPGDQGFIKDTRFDLGPENMYSFDLAAGGKWENVGMSFDQADDLGLVLAGSALDDSVR